MSNIDKLPNNIADTKQAIEDLKVKMAADKAKDSELLQAFIDSGASKEQVDALRKAYGLEEPLEEKGKGPESTKAGGAEQQSEPTEEKSEEEINKEKELEEMKRSRRADAMSLLAQAKKMGKTREELATLGVTFEKSDVDEVYGAEQQAPVGDPEKENKPAETERTEGQKNIEKSREELNKIREEYSKELNKCLGEMRKQISIDRKNIKIHNILAGVKNLLSKHKMDKRDVKDAENHREEDFYTEEYNQLRKEYREAQIELGNKLMEEKTKELTEAGFTGDKLAEALARYKSTDVFNEVVIDERQRVIDKKIALKNKNIFAKAWNAYKEMPRWKKVALSTILFLPLSASTGLGAVLLAKYGFAGLSAFGVGKFTVSMSTGYVTTATSGKLFDLGFGKANRKFIEEQKATKEDAIDKYVRGEIGDETYENVRKDLETNSRKRLRNQAIIKGVTSIGLGMFIGMKTYGAIGDQLDSSNTDNIHNIVKPGINHPDTTIKNPIDDTTRLTTPGVDQDTIVRNPIIDTTHTTSPITNQPDTVIKNPISDSTQVNRSDTTINRPVADSTYVPKPPVDSTVRVEQPVTTPVVEQPTTPEPGHQAIEIEVGKGHGAIQTIRELQDKLKAEYPDPDTAPASVQHILNTKANHLAMEYGMFKPGQDAESALIKLGSSFKVDEHGDISFHQAGSDHDILLERGSELKATGVFEGRMLDTDHSGQINIDDSHNTISPSLDDNTQEIPEGMRAQDLPETYRVNNSDFGDNDQTVPEGMMASDLSDEYKLTHPDEAGGGQIIDHGQSNTENIQRITNGAKVNTGNVDNFNVNKNVNIDEDSARVSNLKTNLTAGRNENIHPIAKDASFDNSNGTNIRSIHPTKGVYETGGEGGPIYPNQGGYQTGEASTLGVASGNANNANIEGNGFTKEVPMTNVAERELNYRMTTTHMNEQGVVQNAIDTHNSADNIGMERVEGDIRHFETAKEIRKAFHNRDIVIDKPDTETIDDIKYDEWNKSIHDTFNDVNNHVEFNSYEEFSKERELQELFGHSKKAIEYVDGRNENVITTTYFRNTPEWEVVSKIPAKNFFENNIDGATKLVDGSTLSPEKIDVLVKGGVLNDNLVTSGGVPEHNYTFTHHDQLERLSKTYAKLVPKVEEVLANDKPIGNEAMEVYIERITKKVFEADDGTLYGVKGNINWDRQVSSALNTNQNVYDYQGSSTTPTSIAPGYGLWQTSSEYNRRITGDVLRNVLGFNNFTRVVR